MESQYILHKTPFQHNKCEMNRPIDNIQQLIGYLRYYSAFSNINGHKKYPYLLLQVRHNDNCYKKVSKLMFHGGIFKYFSCIKPKCPEEQAKLIEFATEALSQLLVSCPKLNTAALIRVDVLRTKHQGLFITEFESLNAFGVCSGAIEGSETEIFLQKYWNHIITSLMKPYI